MIKMQTRRGPTAQHKNSIVMSPDGFRLVKLRQNDTTSGNKKLGFSLRGGREVTGSSVGVFVSHVELTGQASKNGLKVGDQLIQVNGLQVSQATYEEVIELIRRTPKCDEICLLVKFVGRIPFQEKTGEPIRWLQIESQQEEVDTITNPRTDNDDNSHLLLLNDLDGATKLDMATSERRKLASNVNGTCARPSSSSNYQDDSAASSQSLTFTSGASSSCSGASIKDDDDNDDDDDEEAEAEITLLHIGGGSGEEEGACQMVSSAASSSSGCSISMSSMRSGNSISAESTRTRDGATSVRVPGGRRTSEPFGCGVVKGPDEWPGIFVQNVKPASLAERVGLEPGDQLIRAGVQDLSQLPFEVAIALIKSLQQQQDELLLLVRKGAALRHLAECKSHQRHKQNYDLRTQRRALNQELVVEQATARRRKPLEPTPPPAPPSRQHQLVAAAVESVSCAQQQKEQQQQQVGHTKSFKGDSQATSEQQGHRQKQADSSIRFDAASGPINEQQPPCQRGQTSATTSTLADNAKSQQDSPAASDCTNATDEPEQRTRWHAKPEEKTKRTSCTKTISAPPPPPPPADRLNAENVVQTQGCSTERECLCVAGRAPSPPEDRLAWTSLEARRHKAPAASRPPPPPPPPPPPRPCSSPIVAQLDGHRQRKQQVTPASDYGDATSSSLSSSSTPLVVNQTLQTHQSPRSMKLNYDSGKEQEEEELQQSMAATNKHDDLGSQPDARDKLCCHRASGPDEISNANEWQQTGAGKTRVAPENQGSQARSKQGAAKTMRLAARLHPLDDAEDKRDLQEEIKIVKQNCKLHHHGSMQSLVNSRLFQTTHDLKHMDAPSAVEPARAIKCKTHRAPPPPPVRSLQRYVSMDNLSAPQQQQHHHHQHIQQQKHLLMLQQQQQQQQQLNRYKRLGLQASRQKSAAPHSPIKSDSGLSLFQRRSNSVLGQPVASCCPFAQSHRQHQLILRDHHATQLSLNSKCNCRNCQLEMIVTSKTMRHLPRGGPPPVARPSSVTLSKFKAHSEDKLNLMHLNYATSQVRPVAAHVTMSSSSSSTSTSSGSARLVRMQQARLAAEQLARHSAFVSKCNDDSAAHWLARHQQHQRQAPVTTSGVACCGASSRPSGLLRPVACHMDAARSAAHQKQQSQQQQQQRLVFNYSTATGMIFTGRGGGGMSSGASCCAINELTGEQLSRARKSNRPSEFLLLEQRFLMEHQRHDSLTCCSCCCCSTSPSSSVSSTRAMKPTASPSSQSAFRTCNSKQPTSGCGASTDSSGYQSTSGGERQHGRLPACPPTSSQQRGTRTRLSTFNPQPCATKKVAVSSAQPHAPRTSSNLSSTPSIEISSCASSGSLGSATCSPSSSSTSTSCSPLSSPQYLSSTSSCSSAAHGKQLPPPCGASMRAAGHYEVSAVRGPSKITEKRKFNGSPKPRLSRSKPPGGPTLGMPTREHIPCPPPMPLLDDTSQTLRAPTAAASSHNRRKDQRRQSTPSESVQTNAGGSKLTGSGGGGGGGRANKLCFVDELKMLASQQAATESTKGGGAVGSKGARSRGAEQPGESATLIKIINANKQTAARQQSAALRSVKCSCCPALAGSGRCSPRRQCDCDLSTATAAAPAPTTSKTKCYYPSAAGKLAPAGCHRGRPAPIKADSSSAASKLRDEEYTKRRQHELLLEEFKTAHSKMFNKLRQKQAENSKNEQQGIAGDVYDDDQDEDDRANSQSAADDNMGRQQQQQRSSTATTEAGNLVVRPRTTVAIN